MGGFSLSRSLTLGLGSGGGAAAAPLVAAYYDDFKTVSGTLNGRTVGSPTVASYNSIKDAAALGGETVNALNVTTTGKGTVAGTSANSGVHGYRNPTDAYDWAEIKISSTSARLEAHIGASLAAKNLFEYAVGTPAATPYVGGSATGGLSLPYESTQVGDVIRFQTANVAGNDRLYVYHNGRLMGSTATGQWSAGSYNLTGIGMTVTGKHGLRGDLTSAAIDAYMGGTSSVARLSVINFGRAVQINSDGTVDWRIKMEFTGSVAPSVVKYNLQLESDGSTLATGTLSNLVADTSVTPMLLYGTLANFTPTTSASTPHRVQPFIDTNVVDINGVAATLYALPSSPVIFGNVVGTDGQSLRGGADDGTSTGASAVTNGWKVKTFGALAEYARENRANGANTTIGHFFTNCSSFSGKPLNWCTAGVGGSSITTRGVGSASDLAARWALEGSGSKVALWRHTDGQSDVPSGLLAGYQSALVALYADRKTRFGDAVVMIDPVAAMHGDNDVRTEAMRRYQGFELPALRVASPSSYANFVCGPFTLDVQHATDGVSVTDSLHLINSIVGYGEQERRAALIYDFINGLNSIDRRGPELYALAKTDAQTLVLTVKLNGFTGLTAANTGYTTGKTDVFDCGIRFGTAVGTPSGATSATITTRVAATGVSVGTPSGGFVDVTFTFATNTFPGTAYAGGPYGANPFNLSNATGVNAQFATRASMLQGTYLSETPVAIRPYWHSSGNDYLSAS